jgi:phosphonate transport system substrate-binding protein
MLVVPEDSPARTLADLQRRVVAFPSADAFAGYAVPMVALREAGVAVTAKFAGNQEGALAQLKAGQADAAAVNSRFLEHYAEREGLRWRGLYSSEPYHELPVLIHPRVPAEQAEALRSALLGMGDAPDALSVLRQAQSEGFEAAEESDYDNVRRVYRAVGK